MLLLIIYTFYQAILKRKPPSRFVIVISKSIEYLRQTVLIRYRHQLLADLIVWSMKGKRQGNWHTFLCKRSDTIRNSTCGYGNVTSAKIKAVRISKKS